MRSPSWVLIAAVIFGPVVLAAILQPVVSSVDAAAARTMLGWCIVLSLTLLSMVGLWVAAIGALALWMGQWPIVDAAAYPFKPRAEKRGVAARVIGALYVVLGVGLSGSGLLLVGIVLNAFAFYPRVAG